MLTATAVNAAKAKEKSYKLTDAGGLFLLVTPRGQRYWRMNYRYNGKGRTLAFGVFPDVSLADARAKRDAARKLLAAGEDPAERRKQDDREARLRSGCTFKSVAEEWVAKCEAEGRAEKTMERLRWLLGLAYPALGERPITEITSPELLDVLRKAELRKKFETARRLRSTCGSIFRYAIATGRAERDISADLKGALIAPQVTHRAAILDPKGVGELLRAIEAFSGQPTVLAALRLAPHVFVRPGELRHAEWIEFDAGKAVWTIPAHKTKMRRPHKVPLSRQAHDIITDLHALSGEGQYLFPCARTPRHFASDPGKKRIWRFSKDNGDPERKRIDKVAYRHHLYTPHNAAGERDTSFEERLSVLERFSGDGPGKGARIGFHRSGFGAAPKDYRA